MISRVSIDLVGDGRALRDACIGLSGGIAPRCNGGNIPHEHVPACSCYRPRPAADDGPHYEVSITDDARGVILRTIVDPANGKSIKTLSEALLVASYYCADPTEVKWLTDTREAGRAARTELRAKIERELEEKIDGSMTLIGLGVSPLAESVAPPGASR